MLHQWHCTIVLSLNVFLQHGLSRMHEPLLALANSMWENRQNVNSVSNHQTPLCAWNSLDSGEIRVENVMKYLKSEKTYFPLKQVGCSSRHSKVLLILVNILCSFKIFPKLLESSKIKNIILWINLCWRQQNVVFKISFPR